MCIRDRPYLDINIKKHVAKAMARALSKYNITAKQVLGVLNKAYSCLLYTSGLKYAFDFLENAYGADSNVMKKFIDVYKRQGQECPPSLPRCPQ